MSKDLTSNSIQRRKILDARAESRPKRFSPSPIKRPSNSRQSSHTSVSRPKSFTSNVPANVAASEQTLNFSKTSNSQNKENPASRLGKSDQPTKATVRGALDAQNPAGIALISSLMPLRERKNQTMAGFSKDKDIEKRELV